MTDYFFLLTFHTAHGPVEHRGIHPMPDNATREYMVDFITEVIYSKEPELVEAPITFMYLEKNAM